MSTILRPTITMAGLEAVFNAQKNGFQAKISKVGLGTGNYTPDQSRTRLEKEVHKVLVASGQDKGNAQIHMSVIDDTNHNFWVNEVGFFIEKEENGKKVDVLFAVYSHPDKPIAYKSAEVDLLLAFDLVLTGVPADAITIVDSGVDLNILIAPELAKVGAAQISNMYRHLKQKFELMDKGIL
ncbi:phage tail protein [Pseudoalteromonas xiamenensis]|nr:phage tail protein [Pseudoalteromonas xiamenensis]WMN59261.1 phage tail protein [Pseudoalteromonas xiamenensis]